MALNVVLQHVLRISLASFGFAFLTLTQAAFAQDLEPRAFSPSPIGTNFLILRYGNSSGGVGVQATLPIKDVFATINSGTLGYLHTFNLGGHMAQVAIAVPYAHIDASGQVYEKSRSVSRSGFANPFVRVAANLIGCPALTPEQFAQRKPTTVVGASLTVAAPTGTYDSDFVVNTGTNRWSFYPEIGIEQPIANWFVDASAGYWFFTNNNDFFRGHVLSQVPLSEYEADVGYNFHPGMWLSASANYYAGGATSVSGLSSGVNSLANSRYGLSFADPIGKHGFSAKLEWSHWLNGKYGQNFNTVGVVFQYRWFDRGDVHDASTRR